VYKRQVHIDMEGVALFDDLARCVMLHVVGDGGLGDRQHGEIPDDDAKGEEENERWPPDRWAAGRQHSGFLIPALDHSRHLRLDRRAIGPAAFWAALLPGLLLTALYMAVAVGIAFAYPHYAPRIKRHLYANGSRPWRNRGNSSCCSIVTIGGIYAGIFSPTEAAAVARSAASCSVPIGGRLTWATLWQSIETSIRTRLHVGRDHHRRQPVFHRSWCKRTFPTMLAEGAGALNISAPVVMMMIVLAYIVMGCFWREIGMVLITVPVFLPLVSSSATTDLVLHPCGHRCRGRL